MLFSLEIGDRSMSAEFKTRYLETKRKLFDKAYDRLNEQQRQAVYHVNGPLLVLAGAGSGKTTVLVKRIEHIIRYGNAYNSDYVPADADEYVLRAYELLLQHGTHDQIVAALSDFAYSPCQSWRILAITFTNKAASEMKARLSAALGDNGDGDQVWSGTFHKICLRILRRFESEAHLRPGFTIYDTDDSKRLVKAATERLNYDEKQYPAKTTLSYISKQKERLVPVEEAVDTAVRMPEKVYARIYAEYQKMLSENNALDFDDIIVKAVSLLEECDAAREYYQNRFKYVLVDEYQDTNLAQLRLTELLSGGYGNLMVVGDDDQSIYKFRGATIENILTFDRCFPNATVIKLEQNYRSTQNILDAANAVIANNKGRKGKTLWTASGEGSKIKLLLAEDQNDEARKVADIISSKLSKGEASFKDFAILYRANAQSRAFENVFIRSGVPYRIVGGVRFGDREEIKDMMAYFQLTVNRSDNERLKRIINKPRRKIGDKAVEALEIISEETGLSMLEVIEQGDRFPVISRYMPVFNSFLAIINDLGKKKDTLSLPDFFEYAIEHTGDKDDLIARGDEGKDKLENLKELVTNAVEYEKEADSPTLEGFLEESILVADIDRYNDSEDKAVLMTIHSAKGLEFPYVFLPGMEEGLFPSDHTLASENPDEELEEERRLAYVAITRAKKELVILHTSCRVYFGRTSYNKLSRFAEEIPSELIDKGVRKNDTIPFGAKVYYSESRDRAPSQSKNAYPRPATTVKRTAPAVMATPSASKAQAVAEGARVRHRVFGEGTVLSAKKVGNDVLYEVIFDSAGTKKLMGNYAKLTVVE